MEELWGVAGSKKQLAAEIRARQKRVREAERLPCDTNFLERNAEQAGHYEFYRCQ